MHHVHVQVGTFIVGVVLMAVGGVVVYGQVTAEAGWGLWSTVMAMGPIGVGVLLVLPGPTERAIERLAPYLPFLEEGGD